VSFEDDVVRLEAIAVELEQEGVTLERALQLFEEGVTRLRRASSELARAESQVAVLVEQLDGAFALRPLHPDGAAAASELGGAKRA
jgi:exodeoxyribonuclease VII small subunit